MALCQSGFMLRAKEGVIDLDQSPSIFGAPSLEGIVMARALMEIPMLPLHDRLGDSSGIGGDARGRRMSTLETVRHDTAATEAWNIESWNRARRNESMARLLLIEDDKETADEIRAELGDRGFEVDWAANGIEGLDKARLGAAEAIIVDRLLPGMDGLTVI
jgi:hypothetical protein